MNPLEYRGYLIVGDGTYGYKEIKPAGKGSVHLSLRGAYTTAVFAKKAIDMYEDSLKVTKGAKTD
jgi:hypothetical protein